MLTIRLAPTICSLLHPGLFVNTNPSLDQANREYKATVTGAEYENLAAGAVRGAGAPTSGALSSFLALGPFLAPDLSWRGFQFTMSCLD
jgi:hypothetical protein